MKPTMNPNSQFNHFYGHFIYIHFLHNYTQCSLPHRDPSYPKGSLREKSSLVSKRSLWDVTVGTNYVSFQRNSFGKETPLGRLFHSSKANLIKLLCSLINLRASSRDTPFLTITTASFTCLSAAISAWYPSS